MDDNAGNAKEKKEERDTCEDYGACFFDCLFEWFLRELEK